MKIPKTYVDDEHFMIQRSNGESCNHRRHYLRKLTGNQLGRFHLERDFAAKQEINSNHASMHFLNQILEKTICQAHELCGIVMVTLKKVIVAVGSQINRVGVDPSHTNSFTD